MKTKLMVGKRFLKLTTIAIAGILQGCSFMGIGKGDFSCPGGVDGVRCMSAQQVYQATESSDYVKTVSEDDKSDDKKTRPSTLDNHIQARLLCPVLNNRCLLGRRPK